MSLDNITPKKRKREASSFESINKRQRLHNSGRKITTSVRVGSDDCKSHACVDINLDDVFYVQIIQYNDRSFSKKGRGSKHQKVRDTYTLHPLNINALGNGIFESKNLAIPVAVLSSPNAICIKIGLLTDENISCKDSDFEIPVHLQQHTEDNGVFCSCGDVLATKEQYADHGMHHIQHHNDININNFKSSHEIQIYERNITDNGLHVVWTFSGNVEDFVVQSTDTKEDEYDRNEWIQCAGCLTWQHLGCIDMEENEYVQWFKAFQNDYFCKLICLEKVDGIHHKTDAERVQLVLKMISSSYVSFRKNKTQTFGQVYQKKELKNWSFGQLLTLARLCAADVPFGLEQESNSNGSKLINAIRSADRFPQTSATYAQFMASLNPLQNETDLKICELCSGNGNITTFIAQKNPKIMIDAFEINAARVRAARILHSNVENITWSVQDVLDPGFIVENKTYDLIYLNPSFEKAFEFIYAAYQLLRNKDGYIICILPQNWLHCQDRPRLFRILPLKVIKCILLGFVPYYPIYDRNGDIVSESRKPTADAIWILKPMSSNETRCDKWKYETEDPVVQGLLKI
eukprot:182802_1